MFSATEGLLRVRLLRYLDVCVFRVLLLLAAVGCVRSSLADELVMVSDLWCPYMCEPSTGSPGFMVEIAEQILGQAGHQVTFKVLPWSRALKEVHAGRSQVLLGASPENTREFSPAFTFPAIEQARMNNSFFVKKGSAWRYQGVDSLVGQQLGIVQGYAYPSIQAYVDQYMGTDAVRAAAGEHALAINIRKLQKRRISVVLEDAAVFTYTTGEMGLAGAFVIAGEDDTAVEANNLYVSFTPLENNPKSAEYARLMTEGMTALRQSGQLQTILEKYGLRDWRPKE